MSGGSLDYVYSRIEQASEEIKLRLAKQGNVDEEWGFAYETYSQPVQDELDKIAYSLYLAAKFAKEAEWLFSGDTGEESFLKRIADIYEAEDLVRE